MNEKSQSTKIVSRVDKLFNKNDLPKKVRKCLLSIFSQNVTLLQLLETDI